MMQQREKWIDIAKGISILLVIIGHASSDLTGIVNFRFVYGIHLTTFFLLSGYTLRKKPLMREYINSKFAKLMVPYFLTCLAITLTDLFNSWFLRHDPTIQTMSQIAGTDLARSFMASGAATAFGNMELGTRIGAIWFLPALFFALLIFQWLLNGTETDGKLGFCAGAVSLLGCISARFIWFPFSIQAGMFAVFYLWIGYIIKKHSVLERIQGRHYLIAQVILLFGVFHGYCYIGFVTASANDLLLSCIVGLSGSLLMYFLSRFLLRWSTVLEYLGRHSLTILCTHLYSRATLNPYYRILLNKTGLSGNARVWAWIVLEILFACSAAFGLDVLGNLLRRPYEQLFRRSSSNSNRDISVDIAKGILICALLVGQFSIDNLLRRIVYSCHMVAFVVLSGYFYRQGRSWRDSICHYIKIFLIPYAIYVIGDFFFNRFPTQSTALPGLIIHYASGMSFSKNLFSSISSVGPAYFILLLFVTSTVYTSLSFLITDKAQLTGAVLGLSIFGLTLGQYGWWLPWSFDVACYCLVFYHMGRLFREKDLLSYFGKNYILYFPFAAIWAYMIYAGSMEIATRNYGDYGITLVGALSGTILLYTLSRYIRDNLPLLSLVFKVAGKNAIVILIVHSVLYQHISDFIGRWLNPLSVFFLIACVLLQLLISLAICPLFSKLQEKTA